MISHTLYLDLLNDIDKGVSELKKLDYIDEEIGELLFDIQAIFPAQLLGDFLGRDANKKVRKHYFKSVNFLTLPLGKIGKKCVEYLGITLPADSVARENILKEIGEIYANQNKKEAKSVFHELKRKDNQGLLKLKEEPLKNPNQALKELLSKKVENYYIGVLLYEGRLGFNQTLLGELISDNMYKEILNGYLDSYTMYNHDFGACFRSFLENGGFVLPKEREKSDRIVQGFIERFSRENQDNPISSSEDDLLLVARSIIELNDKLHHTARNGLYPFTEKEYINIVMSEGNFKELKNSLEEHGKQFERLKSKKILGKDERQYLSELQPSIEKEQGAIRYIESQLEEIYQMIQSKPLEVHPNQRG